MVTTENGEQPSMPQEAPPTEQYSEEDLPTADEPGDYASRQIAQTLRLRDAPPPDIPDQLKPMSLESWGPKAACVAKKATRLFFEPDFSENDLSERETDSERREREAKAIAICLECPVIKECHENALTYRERGIRGGTTESQRKRMLGMGRRENLQPIPH